MDKVATLGKQERAELFGLTAERMRIHPVNVEKDFWVCWVLKQLFSIEGLHDQLVFKGGTSLSKCFGLIHRFSEDVDLAVNYERLGFEDDKNPRRPDLSHTKRRALLNEMTVACQQYVAGPFLTHLASRIRNILGKEGWILEVNQADPHIVEFAYPSALGERLPYIHPRIVLELGTHAEPIPHDEYPIQPFTAEHFSHIFDKPICSVVAVVAKRTFWEKATILHAEYHRPLEKPLLDRYSRHYADVAVMAKTDVKEQAIKDPSLLANVTLHKDRFYHCGWAKYLDAKMGSFRLLPRKERLADLRRDYRSMRVMFFGEPPAFEDLLTELEKLEQAINRPAG